jgi:hypothetical protein
MAQSGEIMKHFLMAAMGLALTSIAFESLAASPAEGLLENPAPSTSFNRYGNFDLRPLTVMAPYAGQAPNEKAAAKIREHIATQIAPIFSAWSTAGKASGNSGTLVVEPALDQIKFIGGATRFWAGALAGSSYVVLKLKISDKETGAVVAEPEFFQRAAAMSGAWSAGGQDNDMLQRIVTVTSTYLTGNFEKAVGGATGRVKGK